MRVAPAVSLRVGSAAGAGNPNQSGVGSSFSQSLNALPGGAERLGDNGGLAGHKARQFRFLTRSVLGLRTSLHRPLPPGLPTPGAALGTWAMWLIISLDGSQTSPVTYQWSGMLLGPLFGLLPTWLEVPRTS